MNSHNIWIDSFTDICSNKLSALFDRADAKDFVDVFYILKDHYAFDTIWEKAKQKHVGLDRYWFCQALLRVRQIQQMPRMLKPLSINELKTFFIHLYDDIAQSLDEAST